MHSLFRCSGGRHRQLKSHVSVVRINPSNIQKRLRRLLNQDKEIFSVFMASNLTPIQKIVGMRRHSVQKNIIEDLLNFFVMENVLYHEANVCSVEATLESLPNQKSDAGVIFETAQSTDKEKAQNSSSGEAPISKQDSTPAGNKHRKNAQDNEKHVETHCTETVAIYVDNNDCFQHIYVMPLPGSRGGTQGS